MNELLALLAEKLGLALGVIEQNAGGIIAQYVTTKLAAHWIALVIGILLLVGGIAIFIFCGDEMDEESIFVFVMTLSGFVTVCFATYYIICWTNAPIAMIINSIINAG